MLILIVSLNLLVLADCQLKVTPTCDYEGLNLDLSDSGLRKIRRNFLSSPLVKCLNLENNEIWSVEGDIFEGLPNLYYLNLAGNWLPYNNFFYNFSTIRTLVLDNAFVSTSESEFLSRYNAECPSCYRKRDHQGYKSNGLRLSIFADLRSLQRLHLRNNKLVSLSWNQGVPNLTHLFLEGNQIDAGDLATYVPATLTHLFLSNNSINQLDRSPILRHVEELVLDNNNVNVICAGDGCAQRRPPYFSPRRPSPDLPQIVNSSRYIDLSGATRLKKLSMSSNKLKQVVEGALNDLRSLEYLDLTDNFIGDVPSGVFKNSTSLNTLLLGKNQLVYFPNLTQLINLEVLMLNRNEIKFIQSPSLLNLPKLRILSLADNELSGIDPGSFDNLTSLNELDLSGNKLATLPDNWISVRSSLRRLHLDRNFFNDIESMSLRNLTDIQYLNIAGNPFEMLSVKSLMNLPENTVINLKQAKVDVKRSSPDFPSNCHCEKMTCD